MSSKTKFFILLFLCVAVPSVSLWLFLKTDFAQNERAYFHNYPYNNRGLAKNNHTTITENRELASIDLDAAQLPPTKLKKQRPVVQRPLKTLEPPETTKIIETPKRIIVAKSPDKPKTMPKTPMPSSPLLAPTLSPPAPTLPWHVAQSTPEDHENSPEITNQEGHHDAMRGYEAYEKKDFETAITFFERALIKSPNNNALREQLSYAYKKSGHNAKAVETFKSTIDHYQETEDSTAPFALRREVEQLENRLELNSYAIYRDESSNTRPLSGPDLTQSQAGVEFVYQPKDIGYNNGRKIQIYGRMLTAMKLGQFVPDPQSYQAGLGLRFKPMSNHNLVLSLERLIKIGDFARNDWMVRSGYSLDHGTDYHADKMRWWSYSLYLDAALIDPTSKPDIFLTSQITGGRSFVLSPGIVLQPRITALATWQKDPYHKASLYEAGPGINLRAYFNQTKYEAYRSYIDITAEYRIKLSGNSIGGSGSIVSLSVHF